MTASRRSGARWGWLGYRASGWVPARLAPERTTRWQGGSTGTEEMEIRSYDVSDRVWHSSYESNAKLDCESHNWVWNHDQWYHTCELSRLLCPATGEHVWVSNDTDVAVWIIWQLWVRTAINDSKVARITRCLPSPQGWSTSVKPVTTRTAQSTGPRASSSLAGTFHPALSCRGRNCDYVHLPWGVGWW